MLSRILAVIALLIGPAAAQTNLTPTFQSLTLLAAPTASTMAIRLGDLTLSNLAQSGASAGQVPQWNGTAWIPATVTSGGSSYTLPVASPSVLGGVKSGAGISIAGDGTLSSTYSYTLPIATTTVLGGVKATSTIAIGSDGSASLAQQGAASGQVLAWNGSTWVASTVSSGGSTYVLPVATGSALGGVKQGSGVSIAGDGTLSATYSYTLPIATGSALGGVKPSTTIAAAGDGTLSLAQQGATSGQVLAWNGSTWVASTVSSGGSTYVLPTATGTVLGGVKPSTGLAIASDGTLTVPYGTTSGTAAQGNDFRILGALQSSAIPAAAGALLGGSGTAGAAAAVTPSAGIAINAGTIRAIGQSYQALTYSATLPWNVGTAAIASVTLSGNMTLSCPTSLTAGFNGQLQLVQDATGSRVMTWPGCFKWAGGSAGVLSTTPAALDVLTITSFDGTTALAVLSKGFQ